MKVANEISEAPVAVPVLATLRLRLFPAALYSAPARATATASVTTFQPLCTVSLPVPATLRLRRARCTMSLREPLPLS